MDFKKLFSFFKQRSPYIKDETEVRFGRYTDAHKSLEKEEAWQRAMMLYEQKNYKQAYLEFFNFLLDDDEGNVSYHLKEEDSRFCIDFIVYQGSKQVVGMATESEFFAQVRIAQQTQQSHVALHRKLMEANFGLYYSCFSLSPDHVICMRFSTETQDSNPAKLYHGLREIAVNADKNDDALIYHFPHLTPIDDSHIDVLPQEEVQSKIYFVKRWLFEALQESQKPQIAKVEAMISFLYLSVLYRIDYLTLPQANLLTETENANMQFFLNDGKTIAAKNAALEKVLQKIEQLVDADLANNFYATKATFGVARPVEAQEINQHLTTQLEAVFWYVENNLDRFVPLILEYAALYAFFHFGMPAPHRRLLHLFVRMLNNDFFVALGSRDLFLANQQINKEYVVDYIKQVVKSQKVMYPNLQFPIQSLRFQDMTNFAISYFDALRKLDY
jgi:hypothetical protein